MLAQYESRHNQQQASVRLMAGTRHTHDKVQHALLYFTETISFLKAYRHITRTSQRLSLGIPVSYSELKVKS